MKRNTTIQAVRHLVQIASFIIAPGLFAELFADIGILIRAAMEGKFSFEDYSFQIMSLIVAFAVTAVFGRYFCGWVCSFGSMGDLFSFIGRKLHLPQWNPGRRAEQLLRAIKYIYLLFIIDFVWILTWVNPSDSINPWVVFGTYSRPESWNRIAGLLSIGGIALLTVAAGSMFVKRFFCRYICPMGALLSIASALRPIFPVKDREACGSCRACSQRCPMHIDLRENESARSGECIQCLECAGACPKENMKLKGFGRSAFVAVTGILLAGVIIGGYYGAMNMNSVAPEIASPVGEILQEGAESAASAGEFEVPEKKDNASGDSESAQNDNSGGNSSDVMSGRYQDGTYTGSATGYRGMTTVEVTVSGGRIESVEVLSTDDDRPFFDRAEDSVTSQIIDSQSTDVDAVSGATYSSNAIMNAVADALENQ